jgi:16S rRNA C967 or C1407 C5-methylase (RsmB/RsmF family)/NOL1/NOP2/fmu family ribosome biogenesis protein
LRADFEQRMEVLLGDELPQFLEAMTQPPVRGLRLNPAKVGADELAGLLGVELTPVPWCETGFVLPLDAPPLGLHPAIDCGLFYLQDPASMLAPAVLAPEPGWRVADVAAAPGGKATDLAARVGPSGLLLANEVVRPRLRLLESALDRWGSRAAVTASLPLERLGGSWDGVLLDAPCTGEALFRRDPASAREWSEASVLGNAKRQARLLDAVAPLVRAGGVLVYSTCSFELAENEEQVASFLDRHEGWELNEETRVWPHRDVGDGQYVARLVRVGDGSAAREWPRGGLKRASRAALAEWRAFREAVVPGFEADDDAIVLAGDRLYLAPDPSLAGLSRPGLPLGRLRPGRFEPAHGLATAVEPGQAAEVADWSHEYLHGDAVPSEGPDGWVLVRYERWGLGWARRSRGVLKNFFPKGLRRPPPAGAAPHAPPRAAS